MKKLMELLCELDIKTAKQMAANDPNLMYTSDTKRNQFKKIITKLSTRDFGVKLNKFNFVIDNPEYDSKNIKKMEKNKIIPIFYIYDVWLNNVEFKGNDLIIRFDNANFIEFIYKFDNINDVPTLDELIIQYNRLGKTIHVGNLNYLTVFSFKITEDKLTANRLAKISNTIVRKLSMGSSPIAKQLSDTDTYLR